MTHRLQWRSDEGAVLPMTLVALAFLGLVITGLLGHSDVSLRTSAVVSAHGQKVYAADAGLDLALEAIRQDDSLCPAPTTGFQPITPAGTALRLERPPHEPMDVRVECRTVEGDARGVGGFAIIATSTAADALVSQSGGSKRIEGSIFVRGGMSLQKQLIITGNLQQADEPCNRNSVAQGQSWAFDPPESWSYTCLPTATPVPNVNQTLPTTRPSLPAQSPLGGLQSRPGCRVFEPGVYQSAPVMDGRNYFKSGVYVFDNIGTWNIKSASVYGGSRGKEFPRLTGDGPCFREPRPNPKGDGVRFIFERESRINVQVGAEIELYSHQPPSSAPDPLAARRVSIQVVSPGAPSPWQPRPASYTPPVLNVEAGSTQKLVVHGSILAPTAPVTLFATSESVAQSLNGVLASRLDLQSSASTSATRLVVTVQPDPLSSRKMLLRATAPAAAGAERSVVATAVVEMYNDEARTLAVRSRRVVDPHAP